MKLLLTGHHGYIGSVAAPLLAGAGHDVVGLDTYFYRGCDFGATESLHDEWAGDVRDVTTDDLRGFDAVVHLAALSNDPLGDLRPELTYSINEHATVSLATAAKAAGVKRFVFASSCSMYGAASGGDLLDESAPLRPLTPYAESKVRSEQALRRLASDEFSPVSMRNATAYGVSPRLRLDVVLNNLAAWAHTTGRIRLLSDGSAWRPLVHVEDIARATLALLESPRESVHNCAVNIGSAAQNVRIRDLADTLHRLLNCDVETSDAAVVDPRSYRVDFSKLEATLPGFRCEWDVTKGAEQLARGFREVGLTHDQFVVTGRFTRLSQLKRLLEADALDDNLRWTGAAVGRSV